MRTRAALVVIGAFLLALTGCAVEALFGPSGGWGAGTTDHEIVVGPLPRTYVLHVPKHRPQNSTGTVRPFALVLVLHGSSASGAAIEHASQMDSLSELHEFVVAYPDGYHGGGGLFPSDWNAGTCCGAAARENIDDLSFLSAVIGQIEGKLPIDRRRVYVSGFSDGGRMAYHVACQLAATVAAIGVVSGSLRDDHCVPSRPVAVVAVHGTSDDQVAYDDSALSAPVRPVSPAAQSLPPSVQFWAAEDGCTSASVQYPSTDIVHTILGTCTAGGVEFYSIAGGQHAWPGEPDGLGSQPPMSELQASSAIIRFFMRQVAR